MAEAVKIRTDKWESVKITAPTGGLVAGQMYSVNGLVGVIVEDAAEGEEAVLIYDCRAIVVPKVVGTGISFAVGTKVYYTSSSKKVTDVVTTANVLCGRSREVAGDNAAEVEIDLHGGVAA